LNVRAAIPPDFAWFEKRTGYVLPSNARGLAVGAPPRAMVAYDAWTPNSAHVHVAIEAPGTCRRLLTESFRWAFGAVGVLVAVIRESNRRSVRLAQHLGFTETHRIADGWQAGEALIVLEMRREDCRWLRSGDGAPRFPLLRVTEPTTTPATGLPALEPDRGHRPDLHMASETTDEVGEEASRLPRHALVPHLPLNEHHSFSDSVRPVVRHQSLHERGESTP
jgi:hypothetical protein